MVRLKSKVSDVPKLLIGILKLDSMFMISSSDITMKFHVFDQKCI